jgi:hypothetical protein
VIILRHAVEVTGIRHGFHHPPPQTVEGGFVDGHVRIVQRRFNQPIPGVVGVFEVAVEGLIVRSFTLRRTESKCVSPELLL